ncbi:MAG: T9SS type B sorting domain-containing protein, partial [Flavobacterium sp.]
TPNGDGFNDVWTIKNWEIVPHSKMVIFDRYGKLLKELTATSLGWDGTFTDTFLPSDDYWFHLILENGRTIKGHFSLKR